jgi:outer membrane biosynthesis protein TonB
LSRLSHRIRLTVTLAAAAIAIAGCADSRVAGTNPSNANAQASNDQSEQPYKTGYGFTSDGPTTDLYTELFGSSRRDAAPPPAAPQPVEPVVASTPIQPVQPAPTPAGKPKAQRATASAANRQVQPANSTVATQPVQPAPVTAQAVQPPPQPQAPAEADTPAAYGITSNGPTTDLYTALFGSRRRDGQ